jgi:uncharacterized protein YjcR
MYVVQHIVNIYSFTFTVLQALKTQLTIKDTVIDSNKRQQKQIQAIFDGLTSTEAANNRTIDELRNTENTDLQTIQEFRGKLKQCQATAIVDDRRNTNQQIKPVQLECGPQKEVSTCKVEANTTTKWAEIPPAINIANFRSNNVGL